MTKLQHQVKIENLINLTVFKVNFIQKTKINLVTIFIEQQKIVEMTG